MPKLHVETSINGDPVEYLCEPHETMLSVLRETLGMTGTKEGCGTGDCGACSIQVDGRLVCSCLMCGICTPGFIVASKALLEKNPDPDEETIRYWLAGNLCRCTGYDKIVRAVHDAAKELASQA